MAQFHPLQSPVFIERVSFLEQSQFWSKSELDNFQLKKLQHLVNHVHERIPFYKRFLDKSELSWADFKSVEDVKRFPLIDKALIQNNYDDFIPLGIDKSTLSSRTTGGSTGTPLTIYSDLDFYSRDKANTQHYMQVFGLDIHNYKSIRLYGDSIDEELVKNNIFWRLENERKLIMSCYHFSKETVSLFINKINEFKPTYIHTRPSSILPLANYMLELDLKLITPIGSIFCDGEFITDGQRDIIEQAFQSHIYNIFGHTEACVVGHPCKYSNSLHFMPQVGILEILDLNGNEVTESGQKGEMVTTGFNNPNMPLIRYRTGDIGVLDKQECECGRNYKFIKQVEGRIQDYVVDKNSNVVPLAPAIFNYNDMDWKGVKEFKVIQSREGHLLLKMVPERMDDQEAGSLKEYLKTNIERIFAKSFEVEVTIVDELPKTKIGKFRYLDQQLEISKYFNASSSIYES